ncbi:hypothetical protein VNI00_001021 [Paramarasmius palmivorus]|uniref:Uncharacterized protein n=1 Tax=Paramarasmius palmivorus TaxID=297713 RepID=A0AAW0E8V8_9AGAR
MTSPSFFLGRAQPVRLVSAPESLERNPSSEDIKPDLLSEPPSEREVSSPRAASRSTLPSEALEEFLSILKPGIFPPRSPVRSRRQISIPSLQSYAYRGRSRIEGIPATPGNGDELEIVRSNQSSRNTRTPESVDGLDGVDFQILDLEDTSFRWFTSNMLSSPVSRSNTRNPFQRYLQSPVTVSPFSSLSPAAIPLPLPTPDELVEA